MASDALDRLLREALSAIGTATDGLMGGQLAPVAWHNEVAASLFEHYLAAFALASGKGVDDPLTLREAKRTMQEQLDYLDGFTNDIEAGRYQDRDDALRARAELYAASLSGVWYRGQHADWELPFVPGDGSTPCGGRCNCSIRVVDNGDRTGTMTWTLGGDEGTHCDTCPARAGDHEVRRRS